MARLQHRRADRRWSGGSSGFDGGNYAGGDGWSLLNWIGGDHSASDSSAIRAPEVGAAMAVAEAIDAPPDNGSRFAEVTPSKLRPVARLDFGLGFRLAQLGLVVDHLADARKHCAFDPRIR